jgi:hypothetical protein
VGIFDPRVLRTSVGPRRCPRAACQSRLAARFRAPQGTAEAVARPWGRWFAALARWDRTPRSRARQLGVFVFAAFRARLAIVVLVQPYFARALSCHDGYTTSACGARRVLLQLVSHTVNASGQPQGASVCAVHLATAGPRGACRFARCATSENRRILELLGQPVLQRSLDLAA